VAGPPVEAEQLWHDASRWASWVDGFGHVVKAEGDWPLDGARRVRDSATGRVVETVTRYDAGRAHALAVEDERVSGEQRVRFEGDAERTRITVELEVEPKQRMPPARRWWLRRRHRDSLRRTLTRFSYELAAER